MINGGNELVGHCYRAGHGDTVLLSPELCKRSRQLRLPALRMHLHARACLCMTYPMLREDLVNRGGETSAIECVGVPSHLNNVTLQCLPSIGNTKLYRVSAAFAPTCRSMRIGDNK